MVNLFCGDCNNVMEEVLNTESVDLILTSPPYNMTKRKGGYADKCKRYDEYNDWKPEEEYLSWMVMTFNNFDRVLKQNGVVLFNFSYSIENPSMPYKLVANIIANTRFNLVDTLIWKKKSGVPFPANKYRLSRIWEFVFVFVKKGNENNFNIYKNIKSVSEKTGQIYYEVIYNFFEAKNNDGACELNKATFSTQMVERLLNIYACEDTLVLDPFMGTGTTGVACCKNNIDFIGIEISKKQFEYAKNRIDLNQEE